MPVVAFSHSDSEWTAIPIAIAIDVDDDGGQHQKPDLQLELG